MDKDKLTEKNEIRKIYDISKMRETSRLVIFFDVLINFETLRKTYFRFENVLAHDESTLSSKFQN